MVFNYVLGATFLFGIFFAWVNFIAQHYFIAALDCTFVVAAIIVLSILRSVKMRAFLHYFIRVYLCFFYLAVLAAMQLGTDGTITLYAWIFLIPPLSYLLLGRRWGRAYTGIYVVLELTIIFNKEASKHNSVKGQILFFSILAISLIIIWLLINMYEKTQENFRKRITDLMSKDSLTGCFNRTQLEVKYNEILVYCQKQQAPLVLALINIDWFRLINENYGYDEGEKVICLVADLIRSCIRPTDVLFRVGGEEFCLLLPNTKKAEGFAIVEKVRVLIVDNLSYYGENNMFITASSGMVECENKNRTLSDALTTADKRLYKARELGRNQTVNSD